MQLHFLSHNKFEFILSDQISAILSILFMNMDSPSARCVGSYTAVDSNKLIKIQ